VAGPRRNRRSDCPPQWKHLDAICPTITSLEGARSVRQGVSIAAGNQIGNFSEDRPHAVASGLFSGDRPVQHINEVGLNGINTHQVGSARPS